MLICTARRCFDVVQLAWREADRIIIGLLFIAYGVDDLLTPDRTPIPHGLFLEWFRSWEFILAGILYIIGVLAKSWPLRGLATVLYAMGLLTIALIVYFGSGSPTLWLIGAFALQGFADLRRLKEKNSREAALDTIEASRRARGG